MRAAEETSALDADLELLAHAVSDAGALALDKFRSSFKSWTKAGDSPVSEVDIAVNELLRERLSAARPDYAWLSEESVDNTDRLQAGRVWIVDPIDGTRAFIAGKEDWCVSVALVERGRPVVAALFAPVEDTLLLAQAGGGLTYNGRRTRLAESAADIETARVAGPPRLLDVVQKSLRHIQTVPKVHSLALRLARVAINVLDVAFAGRNSHDWDIAAADLIVHEAGGLLTGLDGQTVHYNCPNPVHPALVATAPAHHGKVLALVSNQGF